MKKKDLLSVLLIPIGLFLMATVPVCSQSQPHHAQAAHSGAIALGPGVTIFGSADAPVLRQCCERRTDHAVAGRGGRGAGGRGTEGGRG